MRIETAIAWKCVTSGVKDGSEGEQGHLHNETREGGLTLSSLLHSSSSRDFLRLSGEDVGGSVCDYDELNTHCSIAIG